MSESEPAWMHTWCEVLTSKVLCRVASLEKMLLTVQFKAQSNCLRIFHYGSITAEAVQIELYTSDGIQNEIPMNSFEIDAKKIGHKQRHNLGAWDMHNHPNKFATKPKNRNWNHTETELTKTQCIQSAHKA